MATRSRVRTKAFPTTKAWTPTCHSFERCSKRTKRCPCKVVSSRWVVDGGRPAVRESWVRVRPSSLWERACMIESARERDCTASRRSLSGEDVLRLWGTGRCCMVLTSDPLKAEWVRRRTIALDCMSSISLARHGACEDYDEKRESPPVAAFRTMVDRFRIDGQILLNRLLAVNEGRESGPIPLMKSRCIYCTGCDV